jgi:hypothetical protein
MLALIVATVLIFSPIESNNHFLSLRTVRAEQPIAIKVVPPSIQFGPEPSINQTFTMSLVIENATALNVPEGLLGVEVHFTWNSALIQPVSFTNKIGASGGVLSSPILYGISPNFYNSSHPPYGIVPPAQAKWFMVAAVSMGSVWWGSGTIAEITFKVIYQSPWEFQKDFCTLDLAFTDLVNGNVVQIAHERIDGYYEILGLPNVLPKIAVIPANVTEGPGMAVGNTFTIGIEVTDFLGNSTYGLAGIEVYLHWDNTLIRPTGFVDNLGITGGVLNPSVLYTIGPGFWDDLGSPILTPPYDDAAYYKVTAASTGEPWHGNGTLVEITFEVIYQPVNPEPAASCTFELALTELVDSNANPVSHLKENGQLTILPLNIDIALAGIDKPKTVVGQGLGFRMNLTIVNEGAAIASVMLTVYANDSVVWIEKFVNIPAEASTNVTMTVTIVSLPYGNYSISVNADPLPGESDISDNQVWDGWLTVSIPGDVDGSFKVALIDLVFLANAYGSGSGEARWNANADMDDNGSVGLSDIVILAQHYGQHYP